MRNHTDQRLWVAVHLLYPNSSQALDVYHILIQSLPTKADKDFSKNLFLKLENFFFKNQTVRSAIPFRAFEDSPLENWSTLYKKSQKKHLLVIIGLIIFDFSIAELSVLMKTPEEKVRFLLNQAFKKITEADIKTPTVIMAFRFKKSADNKVSYFFTNENLVEYCLNIIEDKDKKWVEEGLRLYPQLDKLREKYLQIINEIRDLRINKSFVIEPHPLAPAPESQNTEKKLQSGFSKANKSIAVVAMLSIAFIAIAIWRPFSFTNKFSLRPSSSSIKIQEVISQPHLETENQQESRHISLQELPVEGNSRTQTPADALVASAKSQSTSAANPPLQKTNASKSLLEKPSSVAAQAAVEPLPRPERPKPAVASAALDQGANKGKQGGLYRGVLYVSDIETVTSRITERLVSLGGKKAGEVELGWRKGPRVSYYHLTLPEEGIEPARDFLTKFGSLSLNFENHPRAMPAGVKRIILEVKERE